jgi:hypothetical protein
MKFIKFKSIATGMFCLILANVAKSNTIEIVVPYPPGGTVDIIARSVQQELNKKSSIKSAVINKPGGDGLVAAPYFLSDQSNKLYMTVTAALFLKVTNPNLAYDPINDFQTVGPIGFASTALIVSDKSGIKNLDDFVKQSKQRNLNCGTSSVAATFFGNYFANSQGIKLTFVPYKGSAPVMTDLLGGHIDCAVDLVPVYVGRPGVRIIGLSVPDQSGNFDAPVLSRGEYKFENFYAMSIGKTMDPKIRAEILQILTNLHKDPEFVKSMAAKGITINRQFDLNFNKKLSADFDYLMYLDRRLQISKQP